MFHPNESMIMQILTSFLITYSLVLNSAVLSNIDFLPDKAFIEECCNRGRNLVSNVSYTQEDEQLFVDVCQPSNDHIEYPEQRGCFYVQQACCLSQLRLSACRWGVQWFNRQNTSQVCETIPKQFVQSDVAKECCLCCMINSWSILTDYDAMCPLARNSCANENSETTIDQILESSTDSGHFQDFLTTEYQRLVSTHNPPVTNDVSTLSPRVMETTPSPIQPACLENFEWNPIKKVCEKILNSCPIGYIMDTSRKACIVSDKPVKACSRGYQMDPATLDCVDINECKENSSLCADTGQMCVNKDGGFVCRCKAGFITEQDGSCLDINECEIYGNSPCSWGQKCSNTIGSYMCTRDIPCGFGYALDPKTQDCVDIDECKIDPDICGPGMLCINVRGGHQCKDKACPKGMKRNSRGICVYCSQGYYYDKEQKKCKDIDECSDTNRTEPICRTYETCVNHPGSYSCKPKILCRRGTKINANGTSCFDVDECSEQLFACSDDEICVNTYATYFCTKSPCTENQKYNYATKACSCKTGYRQVSNSTCEDINECEEDEGEQPRCGAGFQCVNFPGNYHCFVKTLCPPGMHRFSPYTNCIDIDECATGQAKCGPNKKCQNVIGSYKCKCLSGFRKVEDECEDIDECSLFRPDESCPDVHARCVNIPGSYKCTCPSGFKWMGYPKLKCYDINECEDKPNICGDEHKCINTIGDYFCQCSKGYRSNNNRKECHDINECAPGDKDPKPCPNGICINLPGYFVCRCPKGYEIDKNNVCKDIDECNTSSTICATSHTNLPASKCINIQGGHKCVMNMCPLIYTKQTFLNGYSCMLEDAHSCSSSDSQCLKSRPYRIIHKFIEITGKQKLPQTIATFDMDHLPTGINRLTLDPKYAIDLNTNKPITFLRHTFRIIKSRSSNNAIEVLLRKVIKAPAELLVELQASVYWGNSYLGHSIARIYIYVTDYPHEYYSK